MKKICIDFDGVITEAVTFPHIGTIKPMAKAGLEKLRDLGFYIIISSIRNNPSLTGNENLKYYKDMLDFLVENDIPYDAVDDGKSGKPIADIYVSTRNKRFHGKWRDFMYELVYGRRPKKENKTPKRLDNDDWVDAAGEI